MQFTGKRLELLRNALIRAQEAVQNEIGSHPAPLEYAEDVQELEKEKEAYEKIIQQIERKLK